MSEHRIFLVYSNTGGGHRSAAEAIKLALLETCEKEHLPPVDILMQDVIEKSNRINRLFTHMYNRLLKNHQDWMKYYFALIEWTKPNESDISYRLTATYLKRLICQVNPTVIVSVHPMVNHFLARTLKDLGLAEKIKLITVLTDPNSNLWTGWACPDAALTIAPNDLARDSLISFGLDPARIEVVGMPILPEFLKPPIESREQLLGRLGLNPAFLTVAMTAGSAGGGNMLRIYKALQSVNKPMQVIFICGKNQKLMDKVNAAKLESPWQTVVFPYANTVADGMNACDLLVTKAGGLTTFEAIARRLPMAIDLVTNPMPQEAGTAKMLIEAGLAYAVRSPEDIVPIVESLEVVTDRLEKPLPKIHNLDQVDAVYRIAEIILEFVKPVVADGVSL